MTQSSIRLDGYDAASYMRGRHNSNQQVGNLALLPTPQRAPMPAYRAPREKYRKDDELTFVVAGAKVRGTVQRVAYDWTKGETVYELRAGMIYHSMGYTALTEAIELAKVWRDVNVPLLPAKVPTIYYRGAVIDYGKPRAPRVIELPAPKNVGAVA